MTISPQACSCDHRGMAGCEMASASCASVRTGIAHLGMLSLYCLLQRGFSVKEKFIGISNHKFLHQIRQMANVMLDKSENAEKKLIFYNKD